MLHIVIFAIYQDLGTKTFLFLHEIVLGVPVRSFSGWGRGMGFRMGEYWRRRFTWFTHMVVRFEILGSERGCREGGVPNFRGIGMQACINFYFHGVISMRREAA
jgi:hypothetical protein